MFTVRIRVRKRKSYGVRDIGAIHYRVVTTMSFRKEQIYVKTYKVTNR